MLSVNFVISLLITNDSCSHCCAIAHSSRPLLGIPSASLLRKWAGRLWRPLCQSARLFLLSALRLQAPGRVLQS